MTNPSQSPNSVNPYRIAQTNPEIHRIVSRALEIEDKKRLDPNFLGFAWSDIPCPPARMNTLVGMGLFKISYKSNSFTDYCLADREAARKALHDTTTRAPSIHSPALFSDIIGYDNVKFWITRSLEVEDRIHILLYGPPATAKSLFLEAIATLPDSRYALGGSSSKAGIADFLLTFRPKYLVLDELEKMKYEDFSVLLSLMQNGVVARLKKGLTEIETLETRIYAGCNLMEKLPPELLSRFTKFPFKGYTFREYKDIVHDRLVKAGMTMALADYIADKVWIRTHDVRQALQVGKLCRTREEVDRFERDMT
jgi:Holliday junction DNA helicase RuvB